jgi:hypothetical protein
MWFALYSETWQRGLTLDEILKIAADHSLVARAENSGSEGCYVEVARWTDATGYRYDAKTGRLDKTGEWQRFAHMKCFGGEDLTEEVRESAGNTDAMNEFTTAKRIAAQINEISGNRHVSFVHSLPRNWSGLDPLPEIIDGKRELYLALGQAIDFIAELQHNGCPAGVVAVPSRINDAYKKVAKL